MVRLDQSHLYHNHSPETDMSPPGIEPGPSAWEASTQEKSHSNSGYSELLHMSPRMPQQNPSSDSINVYWEIPSLN
jgi:hypothetical protein